jgi:glycoprotein 3-alpha-L-fucosyltransferase
VWGGCGKRYGQNLTCAGHFNKDCPVLGKYRFYLALENSLCTEYITEKLWWNAYSKVAR